MNDEILINFEIVYRDYNEIFSFKNKFHDHLNFFNDHLINDKIIIIELSAQFKRDTLKDIFKYTETQITIY